MFFFWDETPLRLKLKLILYQLDPRCVVQTLFNPFFTWLFCPDFPERKVEILPYGLWMAVTYHQVLEIIWNLALFFIIHYFTRKSKENKEKMAHLAKFKFYFKYLFEIKHIQYVSFYISKNYIPNNFLW